MTHRVDVKSWWAQGVRMHPELRRLTYWAWGLVVAGWVAGWGLGPAVAGDFQDDFKGGLGEGWTWIREDPAGWRVTEVGLEVRVQPGNMWGGSNDARNLLVRDVLSLAEREVVVSVTVSNRPTAQYEQVDLVWYYDDGHMVKIGQELVDGQLSVVMGREEADRTRTLAIIPLESFTVQVRHRVRGDEIRGEYRESGLQDWKLAGKCGLPAKGKPKVSLQFYQGPAEIEHWALVRDFRLEYGERVSE